MRALLLGFDTECPTLLIRRQLNETIEKALAKSRGRVHLIGHSFGAIIARAIAAQRPADIASVITLGAPFWGTVAHSSILRAAKVDETTSWRSMAPMCFRNVIPGIAHVTFWILCGSQCPTL